MARSRRPAQQDQALAGECLGLQASQLLLASLRKPGLDRTRGISFDELLRNPHALTRRLGANPDKRPLV